MPQSVTPEQVACFCTKTAPSQTKEPINLTQSPDWPFQQIVMDLFYVGNHGYLACADRLTATDKPMRRGLSQSAETFFKAMAPLKNSVAMADHPSHPSHSHSSYETGLLNTDCHQPPTHNLMVGQSSLSSQQREL